MPPLARSAELQKDAGLKDLYAARGYSPLWTGGKQAEARRATMLALLAQERRFEPAAADVAPLKAAFAKSDKDSQLQAELRLSRAALGYLARRRGEESVSPARTAKALEGLSGAGSVGSLTLALAELELIEDMGGWRSVPTLPGPPTMAEPFEIASPEIDIAPTFPPRKRVPDLGALRRRLVQSADLSVRAIDGEEMDPHLTEAIVRFQTRHGLLADGVPGARTLAALNAPISQHVNQVRVNLARRHDDRSSLPRYVEVNVPGFELKLVEKGRVTLRSRVIVGDEESPTPIFDERIRYIELNPFWYVPKSITPELLKKEAKERGYLRKNGFYWQASTTGGPADRLIQRPGPENALGQLKFLFPNRHSVYLHDTAQRSLFSRSERSLSHGCIRVEKWMELAVALLGKEGWTAGQLSAALATAKTRRIELNQPVPIFLEYRTAFVDDEGRLHLHPDLYGHDKSGITKFRGKGLPPEIEPEPPAEPILIRNETPIPAVVPAPAPVVAPANESTAQAIIPSPS